MQNEVRIYEVSVTVGITAHSEEEARAIAYDLLLSRGKDRSVEIPPAALVSEASLDWMFEEEPKANLDDLFEEDGADAN